MIVGQVTRPLACCLWRSCIFKKNSIYTVLYLLVGCCCWFRLLVFVVVVVGVVGVVVGVVGVVGVVCVFYCMLHVYICV